MIKLDIYDVDNNESLYYNSNIAGKLKSDGIYKPFDFNKTDFTVNAIVTPPLKLGWNNLNPYWFYGNSDGTKKTGWVSDNGKWYYLDKNDGVMETGNIQIDNTTYDFHSGSLISRNVWLHVDGKWYYVADGSYGRTQVGWVSINYKWYYFNNDGEMQTGWILYNNKWYYLYNDGAMAVNTKIGKWKVGSDGAWTK